MDKPLPLERLNFSALLRVPRRWLLFCLLVTLHLVLLLGAESPMGRSLLFVHFGLFLLWQPFVGSRLVVPRPYLFLFALLLAGFVGFGSWALILWMIMLGGMVGGRVFFNAQLGVRLFYLLALTDVVASLLLVAVPSVIPAVFRSTNMLSGAASFVLPIVLGASMLLLPRSEEESSPGSDSIDLIYGVFVMLLLAVLVAGSLAVMLLRRLGYFEALLATLAVMAIGLLVLALVWSPRAGFSGLGTLVWRYMLAEGMPFDRVLRDLTELARNEDSPLLFTQQACQLATTYLTWVSGGYWRISGLPASDKDAFGEHVGVEHLFVHGPLQLVLYSRRNMSPTLAWHTRLFVQLIGEYCQTKMQAHQLREMSYMQAVHETGARLTHDVKNLLQSLHTLCAASTQTGSESSPGFQALMQRQLPAITQRLQQTLNKLQQPVESSAQPLCPAEPWWTAMRQRYEENGVTMHADTHALHQLIPGTLFDSALENLLQNAFDKRALHTQLKISASLRDRAGQVALEVEDDGAAIDMKVASMLGWSLTNSENGLGIGLYQVSKQAGLLGYELNLTSNQNGAVCFCLSAFQR